MWQLDQWRLASHRLLVVHLWSRPSTPTDQIITRADYSYKGLLHHVPGTRACSNRAPRVYLFMVALRNSHVCETARDRLRTCTSSLRICTPPFVWCPKHYTVVITTINLPMRCHTI